MNEFLNVRYYANAVTNCKYATWDACFFVQKAGEKRNLRNGEERFVWFGGKILNKLIINKLD